MDIDIDVPKHFKPESIMNAVKASAVREGELEQHNVGIYLQKMPQDPFTELAAIPYKEAEEMGFIKFDILHIDFLRNLNSKDELRALMRKEPNWKLLEDRVFVEQLFQIKNQFELIYKIKPKSIVELADIMCLIRKKHLVDKYIRNKKATRPELYTKRGEGEMRKAHAFAYALMIVVHMNLLEMEYTYEAFA